MTKMYYAENPDSAHDIRELKVTLLGQPFTFFTDSGVFSKKMIDYGSQVLLNTLDFEKSKTLLDLGCGYGPLGISLAKVQGVQATMVDINNRAIDLAQKTLKKTVLQQIFFNLISMKKYLVLLIILLAILRFVQENKLFIRLLLIVLIILRMAVT